MGKAGGGFMQKIALSFLWGPGLCDFQEGECSVMQVDQVSRHVPFRCIIFEVLPVSSVLLVETYPLLVKRFAGYHAAS